MKPVDLIVHGEHEQEWGGYFIIKGLERLVRMLLMTRRNYPITVKRSSWKSRGSSFSEYGVMIRCVTSDQTTAVNNFFILSDISMINHYMFQNNVLHFVTDGSVKLMFNYRKILYYAPLILVMKCLCDYTDHYIYNKLIEGCEEDLYYSE